MKTSSILAGLMIICSTLFSQRQGILLNSPEATESYTLFSDKGITYLIDNCGEIVHRWIDSDPSFHAKLLQNGNLLYFNVERVIEKDWDGHTIVDIVVQRGDASNLYLEYEIVKLENGNYLSVGRRHLGLDYFEDLGFNLNGFSPRFVDVVVEIDGNTGEIVWEWQITDHIIQERDSLLPNYGVIIDHPELLNMDAISDYDWTFDESFMINGMDYNPELDQIALSVRKISEIIIIDHSTSTEEAAGHTGGNAGKGGDILYRWGNPENYERGTPLDRFLYFQHNPKWIRNGPHAGKLTCYNNGLNRPFVDNITDRFSNVPIINTQVDEYGNYTLTSEQTFPPERPDVIYSGQEPVTFYSGYLSGAQVYENGNVFITEAEQINLIELNERGEKVWQYIIPSNRPTISPFRTEKYPLDYPAFEGKDLTPSGRLADDNSTYECQLVVNTEERSPTNDRFQLQYVDDYNIHVRNSSGEAFNYFLFDLHGRTLENGQTQTADLNLPIDGLSSGMYFLRAIGKPNGFRETFKILTK